MKDELAKYEPDDDVLPEGFDLWDGDYEKQFYDVLLRTGELVKACYPNAGYMNELEGKCRKFTPINVRGIKPIKGWPWD